MSDTVPISVTSGAVDNATIDRYDGSLMLILSVQRDAKTVHIPVRIGSFEPLPGYERQVELQLRQELTAGKSVIVTWLGIDSSGLASVSLVPGQINAPAGTACGSNSILAGYAVPSATALAVPTVRNRLEGFVLTAASSERGAWADTAMRTHLDSRMNESLTGSRHLLRPGFIDAHPGLAVITLLLIAVGLAAIVGRDNAELNQRLDARDASVMRRILSWGFNLHVRYFRPRPIQSKPPRPLPNESDHA